MRLETFIRSSLVIAVLIRVTLDLEHVLGTVGMTREYTLWNDAWHHTCVCAHTHLTPLFIPWGNLD